jgi:predicted HicB family RNase H-like nuclease
MKDTIEYESFIGYIHFDEKDNIFYGKIEGINDLITFEGRTVNEIIENFKNSVDNYIIICQESRLLL